MNKKGFTLIELIGVIVLISLTVLIIVPTVDKVIKQGQKTADNQLEANILLAAQNWVSDHKSELKGLQKGWKYNLLITTLKEMGYIDKSIKLPSTKGDYTKTNCVIIKKVSDNGKKPLYEYELEFNNPVCTWEYDDNVILTLTGKEDNALKKVLNSEEWTKENVRLLAILSSQYARTNLNYKWYNNNSLSATTKSNEYVVKTNANMVGTFKYTVQLMGNGRSTQPSNEYIVKIDKKSPTITSTFRYNNANSLIVNIDETNQSGIVSGQKLYYALNTNSTTPPTNYAELSLTYANGNQTASATMPNNVITSLATGKYYLWIKEGIQDNVGNVSKAKKIGQIAIDNTKPNISLSPNSQGTYVKGGKAVTATITDNDSGLSKNIQVSYAWSTSNTTAPTSWTTITATNTKGAKSTTVTIPASASSSYTGTYYLWIKAGIRDLAGNTSNNAKSNAFKFDNKAPDCSWSGEGTSWATSRSITVTGSDANSTMNANAKQKTWTYNKTNNGETAITTQTLKYTVKDSLGNSRECSKTANVYLDTKPPTCSWSGEGTSWAKSRTVTLKGTDANSGINNSGTSWTYNSSNSNGSVITTKSLSYTITDKAGNSNACKKTANIYVDLKSPTCSTFAQYSGTSTRYYSEWTNKSIAVVGTCSDQGSGCTGNATNTISNSSSKNSSYSPGTVYDRVGNYANCSSYTVKIDVNKPSIWWTDKRANICHTRNGIVFTEPIFFSTDNHSGIKSVNMTRNDGETLVVNSIYRSSASVNFTEDVWNYVYPSMSNPKSSSYGRSVSKNQFSNGWTIGTSSMNKYVDVTKVKVCDFVGNCIEQSHTHNSNQMYCG